MTKKKIHNMLEHFYGDYVAVVTKTMTTVQTGEGEVSSIPLIIEGTVVDIDDRFLLLSQDGTLDGPFKLIALIEIVVIEEVEPKDIFDELMLGKGNGTFN